MRRAALNIIVLPAVLLLLAGLAACSEEKIKPPVTDFPGGGTLPDQESWNSTVTFSDSGLVRALLQATHISMYEDRRQTLLDSGLTVDFYSGEGKHTSRLTARRGRVNDATRDLEAFEHVVFVSDSGTIVETEYLFWDNAQRKVRSDKFVTVTSPKERLQGYGFEADQGLKNYQIFRVSGQAELVEERR